MKKTIIYIVVLAALGFGVYHLIFKDRALFGADEAGFNIRDTGNVGRIFMSAKDKGNVLLERTDNGWTVNKKYPAIQASVNALLTTMFQQDAQYPVPKGMHNTAVKGLATNGVKVELYNRSGKKIKVFYVGGQINKTGTFMLMEGAKQPYVVHIPGFEGYLTPKYYVDQTDWRDRTIFNTPVAQLKSITVQYPSEPLNSFTLQRDASGKITVAANEELIKNKKLNERRAQAYAGFFTDVFCEGFLNGTVGIVGTLSQVPKRCVIAVEDTKGTKQQADIYWMPMNKRSKNMLTPDPNVPDEYDADRAYAVINNNADTVLIQYITFDKLFRKAYEFYEVDQVQKNPQQVATEHQHK
jgi:Domain of unknown function (DUF4340)